MIWYPFIKVHNALQLGDWCLHYLAQNYNQSDLTIDCASIFQPMRYPKQVSEGSRLLPVADGGARQDQLKLVDVLGGCLCFSSLAGNKSMMGVYTKNWNATAPLKKASLLSLWVVVVDLTRPNPDTEISSIFWVKLDFVLISYLLVTWNLRRKVLMQSETPI